MSNIVIAATVICAVCIMIGNEKAVEVAAWALIASVIALAVWSCA